MSVCLCFSVCLSVSNCTSELFLTTSMLVRLIYIYIFVVHRPWSKYFYISQRSTAFHKYILISFNRVLFYKYTYLYMIYYNIKLRYNIQLGLYFYVSYNYPRYIYIYPSVPHHSPTSQSIRNLLKLISAFFF